MRLLLALLVVSTPLQAHGGDSTCSASALVLQDVSKTFAGVGEYLTSPLRMNGSAWLSAGAVVAGTGAVMLFDRPLHEGVSGEGRDSYNGDAWDFPTAYGDVAGAGGIGVLLYGAGLLSSSPALRVTGRMILESLASAGLMAFALRSFTGRSRPFTSDGPWSFHPIGWTHEHQSFPSGHATAAFALSTVLGERIGTPWSRIGFYALATLTAVSRVRNNQHWASDVVMGAALGISGGLSATRREEAPGESAGTLRILPGPSGLCLVFRIP
jgi:membrane-associated phospholipid phosphatase